MRAAIKTRVNASGPISSPIFIPDIETSHQVFSALADQGFPLQTGKKGEIAHPGDYPVAVVDGQSAAGRDDWLAYAAGGGSLMMIHPHASWAQAIGFSGHMQSMDKACLRFSKSLNDPIEIRGKIDTWGNGPGNILAGFTTASHGGQGPLLPGIVELPFGEGSILVLLFSLDGYICFLHQRNHEIAIEAGVGSAERIAISGMDPAFLRLPQIDLLMGFLSGWICRQLDRADRPLPMFAPLPGGRRSMVTFSFDDVAPSGKPVRGALERLRRAEPKAVGRPALARKIFDVKAVGRQLVGYPFNYREQAQKLVSLFNRYDASGSVYVLPFAACIQNRPRITGFSGFSKKTFDLLIENGWDVGTHLKPGQLSDYTAMHRAFCGRFRVSPRGHRGHELGWVGWDEDFSELADMGYAYDTTWNWGGHGGLAWVLGTAYPFHPRDRRGKSLSILEMPVTAWLEDLFQDADSSLRAIEQAMDRYPGIYHFGGHSSLMVTSSAYAGLVEDILSMATRRPDAGIDKNVGQLADFWMKRERSGIDRLFWDFNSASISCRVESFCDDGQLNLYLPRKWRDLVLRSVLIDHKAVVFSDTPTGAAVIPLAKGLQEMTAFFGDIS